MFFEYFLIPPLEVLKCLKFVYIDCLPGSYNFPTRLDDVYRESKFAFILKTIVIYIAFSFNLSPHNITLPSFLSGVNW